MGLINGPRGKAKCRFSSSTVDSRWENSKRKNHLLHRHNQPGSVHFPGSLLSATRQEDVRALLQPGPGRRNGSHPFTPPASACFHHDHISQRGPRWSRRFGSTRRENPAWKRLVLFCLQASAAESEPASICALTRLPPSEIRIWLEDVSGRFPTEVTGA